MPPIQFRTPEKLQDWGSLGIDPPKDERSEAELVAKIESGAVKPVIIIPIDGGTPRMMLVTELFPHVAPKITNPVPVKRQTISAICVAVIERAIVDEVERICEVGWNEVRQLLADEAPNIIDELHSEEQHIRLKAAQCVQLCCSPLKLGAGEMVLFSGDGDNPFAISLTLANQIVAG